MCSPSFLLPKHASEASSVRPLPVVVHPLFLLHLSSSSAFLPSFHRSSQHKFQSAPGAALKFALDTKQATLASKQASLWQHLATSSVLTHLSGRGRGPHTLPCSLPPPSSYVGAVPSAVRSCGARSQAPAGGLVAAQVALKTDAFGRLLIFNTAKLALRLHSRLPGLLGRTGPSLQASLLVACMRATALGSVRPVPLAAGLGGSTIAGTW